LSVTTGLFDITDLAYSPVTEFLYAVDFASMAEDRGGIYRIDAAIVDGRQACQVLPVATVFRPTALAFAPDGAMYVTALGDTDAAQENRGILLKITGEL
jgi:DNA-binding beta-propeller fold protein YncE